MPTTDDTRVKAKQRLKWCWAPEAKSKDPTVQESHAWEPATEGLGSCGSRVCPPGSRTQPVPLTAVSRALLRTPTLFLANSAQSILSRTAC